MPQAKQLTTATRALSNLAEIEVRLEHQQITFRASDQLLERNLIKPWRSSQFRHGKYPSKALILNERHTPL